jgi:hypothetical protein
MAKTVVRTMVSSNVSKQSSYFDEQSVARQIAVWSVGTRRHLENWERQIATWVADGIRNEGRPPGGQLVWSASLDHHMCLVALRNLLRALDLTKNPPALPNGFASATVKSVRDLLEHWDENMPIFNVSPRSARPRHRSGQDFADTFPYTTPYSSMRWQSMQGAVLAPDLPATLVHQALDVCLEWAVAASSDLSEFIPDRMESPWTTEGGEWWPREGLLDDHG